MYLHQVITDLEKRLKESLDNEPYRKFISQILPIFKIAVSFHIGDAEKLPIKSLGGFVPFDSDQRSLTPIMYENLSDTHLPYRVCWIDWIETVVHPKMSVDSLKAGCIVLYHPDTPDVLLVCCAQHLPRKGWQIYPAMISLEINRDFSDEGQETRVSELYTDRQMSEEVLVDLKMSMAKTICRLNVFLLLMSCKNISTEVIKAPEALNKKRRKNGKQEIFDYHVLNVVVPSQKRGYREQSKPLSHVSVHLCRGHFKEYTEDHPLFGRYTGRWWWQSAVRGSKDEGIIMKDYKVKTTRINP